MLSRDRVNWLFEEGPRLLGRLDSGPGVGTEIDPQELGAFMGIQTAGDVPWQNVVWVDAARGNDTTAALGRPDKPYATIKAAQGAGVVAGGTWLIHIRAGAYTDTDLDFGGAAATLRYYGDKGVTHTVTGSGHLFDVSVADPGKDFILGGHIRFVVEAGTTGRVLHSDFNTTSFETIDWQCDSLENANGRVTSAFFLAGTLNTAKRSFFDIRNFNANNGADHYFRLGPANIHCRGDFWGGIGIDGGQNMFVEVQQITSWTQGVNGFAGGITYFQALRGLKSTAVPALILRRGSVYFLGGEANLSDGAAPLIRIPANADAEGIKLFLAPSRWRVWDAVGTSDIAPVIEILRNDSDDRFILQGCYLLSENDSTYAITSVGPVTIDIPNGITSNKLFDPNITFRGGNVTVEENLYTGF